MAAPHANTVRRTQGKRDAHCDALAPPPSSEVAKKDWRKALVIQFRATRKRALRQAIDRYSGRAVATPAHSEL